MWRAAGRSTPPRRAGRAADSRPGEDRPRAAGSHRAADTRPEAGAAAGTRRPAAVAADTDRAEEAAGNHRPEGAAAGAGGWTSGLSFVSNRSPNGSRANGEAPGFSASGSALQAGQLNGDQLALEIIGYRLAGVGERER